MANQATLAFISKSITEVVTDTNEMYSNGTSHAFIIGKLEGTLNFIKETLDKEIAANCITTAAAHDHPEAEATLAS
jgi:hypothetical protein